MLTFRKHVGKNEQRGAPMSAGPLISPVCNGLAGKPQQQGCVSSGFKVSLHETGLGLSIAKERSLGAMTFGQYAVI